MTLDERAGKCLDELIGYTTTAGWLGRRHRDPENRANDTNRWEPRADAGESYLAILAALEAAVQAERERCANVAGGYVPVSYDWWKMTDEIAAATRRPPTP